MNYKKLLTELEKHDFKYEPYVYLAIEDENIREELIKNITEDRHINVYYNSYYLINEASKEYPEIFYSYWDALVPLLKHKNSYHRSIAHWILTNLIKVDKECKFDLIKDRYFSMIKDDKFLTGFMALKDIVSMSEFRLDLENEIILLFLNIDLLKGYKETQIGKMQYEIMDFFIKVKNESEYKDRIMDYIKLAESSTNKKTRKKAKEVIVMLNNKWK